jgi:catechol 2,3-dioxygenase-like lactoylglutathione lyase family enzyme
MLTENIIAPTFPAEDIAKVRDFYENKLGLKVNKASDEDVLYNCGVGSMLYIYKRPVNGCDHTEAVFKVDDLESEIADLRQRGIVFEEYDMPGLKTDDGIATLPDGRKSAWFRDTEGNILSLANM